MATQQFDGVDYSNKETRDAIKGGKNELLIDPALAFLSNDEKRERKQVASYNEVCPCVCPCASCCCARASLLPSHLAMHFSDSNLDSIRFDSNRFE